MGDEGVAPGSADACVAALLGTRSHAPINIVPPRSSERQTDHNQVATSLSSHPGLPYYISSGGSFAPGSVLLWQYNEPTVSHVLFTERLSQFYAVSIHGTLVGLIYTMLLIKGKHLQ